MDGAGNILWRFVGATIIISVFLLILNYTILGLWVFKGMNEGKPPDSVAESVAEGVNPVNDNYSVDLEAEKLLKQNDAWAMLLNKSGHVAWSYSLPDELPRTYSLTDVAKFSRNYLMDYPVFVWEHQDGLVVIGYPKNSIARYPVTFPVKWLSELPSRSAALLFANIGLALLLALFIGSRLIKSIKPLISGIYALAREQRVHVLPKGVLSGLANSINHTSVLLQEKNEALKAKDEARSNWISGISHDVRTPLSMVLGYASDLEENEQIPPEQRKQAGIIRQQGEKLRTLVSDLNLVSMLEYDMQPLNMKTIKLSALARQITSEFLNNGLDEKFTLELDVEDENIKVMADEKLLLRAITNLVQNSMTHNPQGCHIRLQTTISPDRKTCRLIVSDNGHGIAQSELPDLLELPYSSKRKNPIANGHGLGLPMVARIAKAHHGELTITSDTGKGFRAVIELPTVI